MERPHRTDDEFFKSLLALPLVARDFLRFVADHILPGLDPDYATLEALPNNFVTDGMRERRADAVLRALWRGTDCWTYFHLEFQSTCPRDMFVRLSDYRNLLLRRLADTGELRSPSGHVSAILSIIVHSGDSVWKAQLDMEEMTHPAIRDFLHVRGRWAAVVSIPEIDMALLADDDNFFVLFLRMEKTADPEVMCRAMNAVSERLPATAEGAALRRLLRRRVLPRLRSLVDDAKFQETLSLLDEEDPMLETKVTDMIMDFKNRVFSEGRAEGEAIGEARGRAEGEAIGEARGEAIGEARGEARGRLEGIMETARNLLMLGSAVDFVVSATGLPLADVERLAAEMR